MREAITEEPSDFPNRGFLLLIFSGVVVGGFLVFSRERGREREMKVS